MRKLGQHFLTSKSIARRIVEAADVKTDDVVLEIGPGKGILTEAILEKTPKKLIIVEKDKKFIPLLEEKYSSPENLEIINGDILEILNIGCLMPDIKYKIVANIPYYITSRLSRLIFSQKNLPERIVLMVQKEVAERICARPPHMNLLALSVQAYGKPKIVFRVSKTFFKPRPKVDSAVIVVDSISHDFFQKYQHRKLITADVGREPSDRGIFDAEIAFFDLLHAGFRQKRKLLLKNLANYISDARRDAWINAFRICGLDEKSRAENLSLEDWGCLVLNRRTRKQQTNLQK